MTKTTGRISPSEAAELVHAAAAGSEQAWARLVDGFLPLLWSTVRRFRLGESDAADVVQTTWLRLVQHLDRLYDATHVAAWIVTTASREAVRVSLHAQRTVVTEDLVLLDRPDVDEPTPDRVVTDAARDDVVREIFRQLPDRDQEFLGLLLSHPPLSYAEISSRLGMPVGSIGPTRARALNRLAVLAGQQGVELQDLIG